MIGGRKLAAVAGTIVIALGGTVISATPANASPGPGCQLAEGHYEQAGGYITGYRYWFCENGDIPLGVSVQRYLSPGVYETVASGTGEATYYCAGSLYNVYRTTGTGNFGILCS